MHKKALNKIYVSFLRPIIEYSSTVWDGCTAYEKDSLEKIQNEAARIVTGLTRSVSLENLYSEIGWFSLSDRRRYQKLVIVYKSKNGLIPEFLVDLFPPNIASISQYDLRNNDDYVILNRCPQPFANSFIPSSTELWNQLPLQIRRETTLSSFKTSLLRNIFVAPIDPTHFDYGNRKLSIIQVLIRNRCGNLNQDLYLNRLRDTGVCDCGSEREDAEHFFKCYKYLHERRKLFRSTHRCHPLNLDTVLRSRDALSFEDNVTIFSSVHEYIRDTNRF